MRFNNSKKTFVQVIRGKFESATEFILPRLEPEKLSIQNRSRKFTWLGKKLPDLSVIIDLRKDTYFQAFVLPGARYASTLSLLFLIKLITLPILHYTSNVICANCAQTVQRIHLSLYYFSHILAVEQAPCIWVWYSDHNRRKSFSFLHKSKTNLGSN